MRLVEFVSEAQRPGFFGRIGSKIASKFGSASAQGATETNDNFKLGWQGFEKWRGQSGLKYAKSAGTTGPADTITGASIAAKWQDNAMIAAMKEMGIPLNSQSGITQAQATDLIYTYSQIITTGSVAPGAAPGAAPAPAPKSKPKPKPAPKPAAPAPAPAPPPAAPPAPKPAPKPAPRQKFRPVVPESLVPELRTKYSRFLSET